MRDRYRMRLRGATLLVKSAGHKSATFAAYGAALAALAYGITALADPAAGPAADTSWPTIVGAQFTSIVQNQSSLRSPYQGPLSLDPSGDTEPTETIGLYLGWAPFSWAQLYLDTEKFNGAGVSNATGLAGLTNGDVIREGASRLPKRFYVARKYLRLMWPLAPGVARVEAAQDQIGGTEATSRLELKFGLLAANDDFDRNRYANSARTQFLNWSLWNDTAWDYAADTRGYSDGGVLAYVSPTWSVRYGAFLMPAMANGQQLEESFRHAHGQQAELTLSPWRTGTIVRFLAYQNIANMGIYSEALAIAAATHGVPNIVADDRPGRQKYGFGVNLEQPLADDGATGVFVRAGWNNGATESFVFTEVDRLVSLGGQLSGVHWHRRDDYLGIAWAQEGLSSAHAAYLAAGGEGFLLGDGALSYAHERIFETYYNFVFKWPFGTIPGTAGHAQPRLYVGPDFQYVSNPGYNAARGPVHFWGVRAHLEY